MASARETTTPNSSPKAGVHSVSASQPIAQEIPVIASGARPASAAGKRELFTEATSTVLVSENGAVIRLSAAVVPGQLLFLIHQESKREVVTQVLRKRYFRPTNCYVELEFTEPAPGFWGMEFPAAAETCDSESRQAEEVARVQSAKPTADSPRKPSQLPSAQEVTELKHEVEVLRDQLKSGLQSKTRAVSLAPSDTLPAAPALSATVNTSGVMSPHPVTSELPKVSGKLSRLPVETAGSFPKPVLHDSGASSYGTIGDSSLPSARSSKFPAKPEGNAFRRIIPVAAGLLVLATGAAWLTNHLPGLPSPMVFSAASSSAASHSTNSIASAPIHVPAQKTDAHDNSSNASGTPQVAHETEEMLSYNPPVYQPDKTPDRGSILTVTKKNSSAVNVVKRAPLPFTDKTSSTPASSEEDGGIVPPRLLTSAQGIAPPEAVRGFVTGNVVLDAVVGSDGRVVSSTVVTGRPSLRASAIETLKHYRYQPATHNGKAVSAHVTVTVQCWFEP